MWDVIWTDPDRQSVKDHRAKKKGRKTDQKQMPSSKRSSMLTTGSGSSGESPFGIFRSKQNKQRAVSPYTSGTTSPSMFSSLSPLSQVFESKSRRSSGLVTTAPSSPVVERVKSNTSGSRTDSQLQSKQQEKPPVWDEKGIVKEAQPSATVLASSKDGELSEIKKTGRLIELLQSLSDGKHTGSISISLGGVFGDDESDNDLEELIAEFTAPPSVSTTLIENNPEALPDSPTTLVPPPKSPLRLLLPISPMNDVNSWKTPKQWAALDAKQKAMEDEKPSLLPPARIEGQTKPRLEEVKKIAVSRPQVMLARLNQLYEANGRLDVNHQNYTEMAIWALSTFFYSDMPLDSIIRQTGKANPAELALVLQESSVSAMYIAALHAPHNVHHVSSAQSSYDDASNLELINLPSINAKDMNLSPMVYQSAYAYSMPSRYPASELEGILRNVRASLRAGGILNLVLIDPMPCLGSMGEHMWRWMNRYVTSRLEGLDCCLEPTRRFPKLLGNAGLRGEGSRCTKIKFYALQQSSISGRRDPDRSIDELREELETKAQVRTLVGRLVWMETWGSLIEPQPTKWWWEDKNCVDECLLLGTFWEMQQIEAVRSNV